MFSVSDYDVLHCKVCFMTERPPAELRVVALVSGLDSCVMVGLLARDYYEITPLYVRAGLRWEDAEV